MASAISPILRMTAEQWLLQDSIINYGHIIYLEARGRRQGACIAQCESVIIAIIVLLWMMIWIIDNKQSHNINFSGWIVCLINKYWWRQSSAVAQCSHRSECRNVIEQQVQCLRWAIHEMVQSIKSNVIAQFPWVGQLYDAQILLLLHTSSRVRAHYSVKHATRESQLCLFHQFRMLIYQNT